MRTLPSETLSETDRLHIENCAKRFQEHAEWVHAHAPANYCGRDMCKYNQQKICSVPGKYTINGHGQCRGQLE